MNVVTYRGQWCILVTVTDLIEMDQSYHCNAVIRSGIKLAKVSSHARAKSLTEFLVGISSQIKKGLSKVQESKVFRFDGVL